MPDQSFRTMLANLEQQGEMIRFTKEVDPETNMAAVEWRAYNELGKASLFTNIAGHDGWQACSQIVADRRKWSIGLGIDEDQLLGEIGARFGRDIAPVTVDAAGAPIKAVKITGGDVDLLEIPSMFTSEHDGGRYLASGIAVIKDPETGLRNVSIHRQQITGKDKTGFIMLPRQARRIFDKYKALGEPMPVSIFFGCHPAIFYAAAFTTDFGRDEMSLAGGLLGEPVRMVKCETNDLEVPAEAEPFGAGRPLRRGHRHLQRRRHVRGVQGKGDHQTERSHLLCAALRRAGNRRPGDHGARHRSGHQKTSQFRRGRHRSD